MSAPVYALVISAHPDDAEFGCAGTVALWAREEKRVAYVVCTSGNKGTSDPKMTPEKLARIREREQRAAAKVLGVSRVVFLGHPDQGLEDTPEFRKELVREIRRFRPEIVLGPDPYRRYIWHRDHRITGQVILDAVYPYARDRLAYPDLLDEGFPPHAVKEVWMWGADDPNHKVDVTRTYDLKLKALRCHRSQVGERFAKVEQWIREHNASMAKGEPYRLAEAFHREEILM